MKKYLNKLILVNNYWSDSDFIFISKSSTLFGNRWSVIKKFLNFRYSITIPLRNIPLHIKPLELWLLLKYSLFLWRKYCISKARRFFLWKDLNKNTRLFSIHALFDLHSEAPLWCPTNRKNEANWILWQGTCIFAAYLAAIVWKGFLLFVQFCDLTYIFHKAQVSFAWGYKK